MNIILWIIFGALSGWIASRIMNTSSQQGFITDIVVGVVGAFLGGFIFNLFGAASVTGFNIYSLLVAVVGSVTLLWIAKSLRRA